MFANTKGLYRKLSKDLSLCDKMASQDETTADMNVSLPLHTIACRLFLVVDHLLLLNP